MSNRLFDYESDLECNNGSTQFAVLSSTFDNSYEQHISIRMNNKKGQWSYSRTAYAAEVSVVAIELKATLTGGATSAAGFFMGINWIGVGIAVLGLLINFYFS